MKLFICIGKFKTENPKKQLTIYTAVNKVNNMLRLRHALKPLLNQGLYAQAGPRLKYLQWEQ